MKKSIMIATIGTTIIIAALVVALLINFWPKSNTQIPPDYPAPNVKPIAPQYLKDPQDNETKLFLLSSTPKYGYYRNQTTGYYSSYPIHPRDPCFIINITIRNDYSIEELTNIGSGSANTSFTEMYFILYVRLYDKNGLVNAVDVTSPISYYAPWVSQISLASGETASHEMFLATTNRNIDHYEVYIGVFSVIPIP